MYSLLLIYYNNIALNINAIRYMQVNAGHVHRNDKPIDSMSILLLHLYQQLGTIYIFLTINRLDIKDSFLVT